MSLAYYILFRDKTSTYKLVILIFSDCVILCTIEKEQKFIYPFMTKQNLRDG